MSAVLCAERRISGPYLEHHADMRPMRTPMSEMVQQRNDMRPPRMRSCFPRFPLPNPNSLVHPTTSKTERTELPTAGLLPNATAPSPAFACGRLDARPNDAEMGRDADEMVRCRSLISSRAVSVYRVADLTTLSATCFCVLRSGWG